MWSPTRRARVSGERPDKKSLTCREQPVSPRTPALGAPSPARPGPPRCVTWGLSPPLSGFWGPCRCHGCLNKMNRYFRKPPPPARPGPGAAGGCGGQRQVRQGGLALPGQLGSLKGKLRPEGAGPSQRSLPSNNPHLVPFPHPLKHPDPLCLQLWQRDLSQAPSQLRHRGGQQVGAIAGQILHPNLCFLKINIYLSWAGQRLRGRRHCFGKGP